MLSHFLKKHLFIYLFLERGKGREKKKERERKWPLIHAPTRDWTLNPGVCTDGVNTMVTFQFEGQRRTTWTTPVRAMLAHSNSIINVLFAVFQIDKYKS